MLSSDFNLLNAHAVISRHAVAVTKWPGCLIKSGLDLTQHFVNSVSSFYGS